MAFYYKDHKLLWQKFLKCLFSFIKNTFEKYLATVFVSVFSNSRSGTSRLRAIRASRSRIRSRPPGRRDGCRRCARATAVEVRTGRRPAGGFGSSGWCLDRLDLQNLGIQQFGLGLLPWQNSFKPRGIG